MSDRRSFCDLDLQPREWPVARIDVERVRPAVRNDREAVAPMRGVLVGLLLGLLVWAAVAGVVLVALAHPDPVSWLAAYVVGPMGLLLALAGVVVAARGVARDVRSSFGQSPRPRESAGPALGRTGPALPPTSDQAARS